MLSKKILSIFNRSSRYYGRAIGPNRFDFSFVFQVSQLEITRSLLEITDSHFEITDSHLEITDL